MKKQKVTDIYTQIYEIVRVFGKNQDLKTIKEKLEKTHNKKIIEILRSTYDTSDLNALAILIKRQHKYYNENKDIYYLVGSQPSSQKHYVDFEQSNPVKKNWRKLTAITQQSEIKINLSEEDKIELLEVQKYLKGLISTVNTENLKFLREGLIFPIMDSLKIRNLNQPMIILNMLFNSWVNKTVDNDELQTLSPSDREFFLQANSLYQYLRNPIEKISRNEHVLLMKILPKLKMGDNFILSLKTEQHDLKSPISAWPMSLHGRGIDSQHKIATSKNSIKLLTKNGQLYTFNTKNRTFHKASTSLMNYKNSPNNAGLIITLDGSIHIFNHTKGQEIQDKHFHSMVTSGQSVLFAGSIQIVDGYITMLTSTSGHYQSSYTLEFLLFLSEKNLLHSNIQYLNASNQKCFIQEMLLDILDSPSGKASIQRYLQKNGIAGFYKIVDIKAEISNNPHDLTQFMFSLFIDYHDLIIQELTPSQVKSDGWENFLTNFTIYITNNDLVPAQEKFHILNKLRNVDFDLDAVQDPNTEKFCIEIITDQLPLLSSLKTKVIRSLNHAFEYIHYKTVAPQSVTAKTLKAPDPILPPEASDANPLPPTLPKP